MEHMRQVLITITTMILVEQISKKGSPPSIVFRMMCLFEIHYYDVPCKITHVRLHDWCGTLSLDCYRLTRNGNLKLTLQAVWHSKFSRNT